MDSGLLNVLPVCFWSRRVCLLSVCLSVCVQHKSKSSERIVAKFSEKVSNDKSYALYSYTMQFANMLPFSQHLATLVANKALFSSKIQ